ncbi:RICIN domain-containing protein [Ruminococcus bicirculans]|nr:RICIN domain-containing protein [Ruminococcus bicirculans (ex Wegman et al. 2014)]
MKKRIASLFTSLLMIVSLMVVMPTMSVSAANNIIIAGIDIGYSNGSYFTKNGKSCATMSGYWSNGRCHKNGVCDSATSYKCNCMRYYPTGNPNTCQVDLKASQCWGFARYCEWKVYGFHDGLSASKFKTTVGKTNANSCTESYIKSNFYNIAVASHLRTGDGGHSLSIISTDESGVIWVDCNSDGYCKVIVHNQTWAQFANYLKGRSGISYVYSFIGGKGSAEASSKPGRSAISVKTGTSYKCTTFNWTASSNTKVYSIKIHKNGTLFKENTTAATSWSVILPVGDYEAYVDSCNDSGYTCSNTVKFTIEKGNPVPSSTTVSASAGTNYTPTSISWLKTTNTNEYDVKIWRGTAQKGEAYKILWGEKGTSCLVDLPAGYYEAYVDSRNDYECSMSANIVKFTVTDGNYLDIGDDFYASLLIYKNWLNVTNENGSITVQKSENASARQIWFFDRQSDGSYTIKNCADGSYLDSCSPNGGLAQSKKYSGSNTQKWYIFGRWSGEYYFKPKSVNIVLDVKGNITTGDKVQVCGLNYRDSQKFAIYKLDSYILPSKINLNSGSATIEAGTTKSLTATILPTNSTNKTIIWSTSDASIATVSGGTVTGKKAGTVTITAKTTNGLTANAQIKVVSGHTFGTWTTTKNATCTQVGTKSRKCTVCGKTETQTIAKTGHKSVTDKAIPATCTTDGKTEGSHCSVCGAVIKAQEIIKATGHKFGNWTTTKSATCTESGTQIRKCENCGATESKSLSAKGHTEVVDKAIPATCTTDGKTEGSHCSVCGAVIKAQDTIKATGHKFGNWTTIKPATCTESGTQIRKCETCGATESKSLSAKGHTEVVDKAIPATCTTDGKTEGSHCSVCGAVIKAQDTIKATGHKFGNWTTTKSATCTESGTQIRKCETCGATESKSLSAKGHTEVVDKAIPATCTTDGKTEGSHCSVCGAVIKAQTTITATGHKSSGWIVDKTASIGVKGSKHKECTVCKKVLETAEIPALSRISISKASVTLSTSTYAYDGKTKTPSVTVKVNGKTLKKGTDYTVSYSNNTKVGTATVKITGKGNYTGSVSKTYSIKNNFKKATVSGISNKSYTGKNITQSITVKYNGKTLKKGTDYTVSYSSSKSIGTATVKIAGKGSYTGTITKTFKINPAKQEIQKLTAKSKAFFVDWAQKGSATGYEIQYATNSKFTSAKKVTITNKKTDKTTISKLSGKKKYYVRVRSYTTVKGTKYYGAWSASKSVTTKK